MTPLFQVPKFLQLIKRYNTLSLDTLSLCCPIIVTKESFRKPLYCKVTFPIQNMSFYPSMYNTKILKINCFGFAIERSLKCLYVKILRDFSVYY